MTHPIVPAYRSASPFLLVKFGTGVCILGVYTLTLILSLLSDRMVTTVKLKVRCLQLGSRASCESISDCVRSSYWLKHMCVLFAASMCCSPTFMDRFVTLAAKSPRDSVQTSQIILRSPLLCRTLALPLSFPYARHWVISVKEQTHLPPVPHSETEPGHGHLQNEEICCDPCNVLLVLHRKLYIHGRFT